MSLNHISLRRRLGGLVTESLIGNYMGSRGRHYGQGRAQ
jgi:hypothetical protein